VSRILAQE